MEEVINSEFEQVAPDETSNHVVIEQTETIENTQEKNWRELNRVKKELERKTKMQDELIERLMQRQEVSQKIPQEIDELDEIPDDDYVPKGKQKKLVRKEVEPLQRKVEELEAQLKQQALSSQFDSLKRKYSDFDDVVNHETIAIFEEQEPELAQTIVDMKDPYKIGIQTYKYIKALNISEKIHQSRRAKEIDKKIESNKKTVQSPQAFDKRPMAQAFRLTESEKSKLYEEMMYYASMSGSAL